MAAFPALAGGVPALLLLLAVHSATRSEDYRPPLSRNRAAAALTALFHHGVPSEDASRGLVPSVPGPGKRIGPIASRRVLVAPERAKMVDFANSLVYEGGYFPAEIYRMLGYNDVAAARVARLARQLDSAAGNNAPAPWEAAGRVGRSGLGGVSDNWSMAPEGSGLSSPGTLAYLPILAISYAAYPVDGREAASQLAILKDDDLRAAPVARAAFSLLHAALTAGRHDKNAWVMAASTDSGDADTGLDVRAARVKDWRYLRGEECAMGRLERTVYLWYRGGDYGEIMSSGREKLQSRESLAYLASLAAVTYGMESLPRRIIAAGSGDRQLLDLINDLYDLAVSEAVLRVAPEAAQ